MNLFPALSTNPSFNPLPPPKRGETPLPYRFAHVSA